MPYKVIGNKVVHKNTGKVVGHSKNPERYMRKLNMLYATEPKAKHNSKVKTSF